MIPKLPPHSNIIVYGIRIILVMFIVAAAMCGLGFAQSISSAELINKAKLYDGKPVTYEGEVIGDMMKRGEFAWINVNDGQNAIGIWADSALLKEIAYAGSYKSSGDKIRVTGVFHRACAEHGGDLDIHASGLQKISSGRLIQEKISAGKKELALILLGLLGVVWILSLLKRK